MKYFITLSILIISNFVLASGQIQIATEDQDGIRWLDLYGENIPAAYGMELEIIYPNKDLIVVDANEKVSGPQIFRGDFFSESAYEIANNIDTRTGRIRYAISLLKPADPVLGNGHLARIGFTTKSNKAVSLELANIKFGTQAGKVVKVSYPSSILIEPALSIAQARMSTGFKSLQRKLEPKMLKSTAIKENFLGNNMIIIGLLSLIGLLLLIVIILLLRRQPVKAS